MLNRYVSLAACLCLLAGISVFGQANQGAGYVFELPGPNSAGSGVQGFVYNGSFLSPEIPTANGPAGARQVIAKPDGTKLYVLGANAGGLESTTDFIHFSAINGISGSVCVASITPNGRYLLVGAAGTGTGASCGTNSNSNSLYILDTSNDGIIANSLSAPSAGIIGFAVSPDSNTAWMLTNSPSTGAIVTAFNLNARPIAQTAKLNLPYGDATSITLSPQGLLYVTGGGAIYEITTTGSQFSCNATFAAIPPLCITPNGYIQVEATPGPLRFTPSGQTAYAVNTDPQGYPTHQSLLELTVATRTVVEWPPANSGITPPTFSDVLVAGENTIYAITTTDPNYPTTLWDVNPSPLSAGVDTTLSGIFPTTSVISATVSNELPSAVYLYALVGNGNQTLIYRVNLANKSYVQQLALLGPGLLQFVVIPPETGAAGFLPYSPTSQTLPSGTTSAQLTALVLDATGRPVYNLPVTFSEASTDQVTGAVITGATQTTNANGYVTATVTVPTTPSTYTVVLTAGAATLNFALTVPGASTGGGGGGGNPSNQVIIISGNGEFMQEQFPPFNQPLTVQVVDTKGVPLAGVPVAFTITGDPIGQLDNPNPVTDVNGFASTDFTSPNLPQGQTIAFDSTTVNASTSVGSVNFIETVYRVNQDGTGAPQISVVTPISQQLTVGEGDVLTNGIIEKIQTTFTGVSQAIPNVGIRLASGYDYTQSGIASCQGSTLSDLNGLAHCNVYVSCQAGLGVVQGGINVVVGEKSTSLFSLNVVPGTSQVLNIKSGNNQSGNAGSTLANQLVATVTDNCGNAHANVPVTWNITQGSATLTNTTSTTDSGGNVHTGVVLGQSPGTVLVTVSAGTAQATFTVTNLVVVKAITLVSGGGQTALTNVPFAQPLVFVVTDANGKPVPGIVVTLSVASGSAAVNTATATTNAQGQVSTTVNSGSTAGPVTVIASTGGLSASAGLTVILQGPQVTATSFTNAATTGSLSPQVGLVPCGLNSVTGAGLAGSVSGVLVGNPLGLGPLPYTLGGVSISINGVPAPLLSVSNSNGVQQVNFQTPCETAPGSATAVVQVNGATTVVSSVQVLATQPGIINYAGPNNTPYGYVIRALDGSYVTPSNPARRGETYYMVLTGLGQTTPPIITNATGTGSQIIPLPQVVVGVNNVGVPVTLAEYASGQIGVYVVAFTIPPDAATGANQPLAIKVNGVFGNTVYLPSVN